MGGFKAAFINEIERMYKKKKAVVIVVVSLVVIILGQLAVTGVRYGFGIRGASSTEFPILVLSVLVNTILPLFTALVAIDIFTGEFSQNTMKIILTRPISRLKLFTAKITAICFFVLANLIVVMLLSLITGFIFNSSSASLSGLVRVLVSYMVTLLPIMVLALIIVFFANILRNGTAVFFLSAIIFIAFKALGFVFSQYSSIFITSTFDWYNLWIANVVPLSKVIRQFLIMAGYGIMFFTAGYYVFDNKNL